MQATKVKNGVYVRTFKDFEIQEGIEEAKAAGHEPYEIRDYTPYLYMIRETGGIATGAYIDGRNAKLGKNEYYDSNIGIEAYLLELGYLNNEENLEKLVNDKEGYIEGIVQTVREMVH